ncbi:uncharacterized protein [Typha angustifolia]|uniref:uncharacterized protein n=1 Tax=Typha angustifolia TaxID=59011 RepID=UPI003C2D24CE
MGNTTPVETKKRKKKGRPSLLDIEKRSLRLQKLQEEQRNPNPNPTHNPYLRSPAPVSGRRTTRQNPNPNSDEEEEEEEGRRREKKLRHVLRLPNQTPNSPPDSAESDKKGKPNSTSKATDGFQETSDSGPTTNLPDKKLLEFVLDRLQKKDKYGVFAEPVDPEELPDYHDIIKHPMDFGTIRKNLSAGVYKNLEQFENDVFLICSNAMCYNAPDTIFYRQARAIQELAKKDFESLRQESDNSESEVKPCKVKPLSKSVIKQKVGGLPAERASTNFSSDTTLANAGIIGQLSCLGHDLSRKGLDKLSMVGIPTTSYGLRTRETWSSEHKSERNEDFPGSFAKGTTTKYGKKSSLIDEARRNTYKQTHPSTYIQELHAFNGERKQLVPVGLHMQHAYARSLARFAAKLGPIGWAIAAKRIEGVLPPGSKFGCGWVGDGEAPQHLQPPLLTASPPHSSFQPKISATPSCNIAVSIEEPSLNSLAVEGHATAELPNLPLASVSKWSTDSMRFDPVAASAKHESKSIPQSGGATGEQGVQQKSLFHIHQNPVNGCKTALGFSMASQIGKAVGSPAPPGSFCSESMTHGQALDMVSRSNHNHTYNVSQSVREQATFAGDPASLSNSGRSLLNGGHDQQGLRPVHPQYSDAGPKPADLNAVSRSPRQSTSSVLAEHQPDLALQL